ncbi:uncharacterized protein LOC107019609 [Solanum pennellii]|uniref:Uncharacterized protein LOC107019609 n=1 Tax=Solanum pennellii TaxID=28526 RepID=A0ABM1GSY2_SOLPN|nr:uncharacterized protein LOC107019609 [Solanum pennellii]
MVEHQEKSPSLRTFYGLPFLRDSFIENNEKLRRDKMTKFVTGVSKNLEKDCRVAMVNDNIELGRFMNKTKFKKGHQHSGNPTPSRNSNAKVEKSGPQKGNHRNAQHNSKPCGKCGRLHGGECFVCTNSFYGCSKSGDVVRDCPHVRNRAKRDAQPWLNPNDASEPPKRNRFYIMKDREEQEK